jgi:hypothetical protein
MVYKEVKSRADSCLDKRQAGCTEPSVPKGEGVEGRCAVALGLRVG